MLANFTRVVLKDGPRRCHLIASRRLVNTTSSLEGTRPGPAVKTDVNGQNEPTAASVSSGWTNEIH